MRVLVTGGGTGGHINPALAIASCIQRHEPDVQILYAGTPDGMEARLVKNAGFDFAPIQVKGFWRGFSLEDIRHNLKTVRYMLSSPKTARKIITDFKPDIVIGTGGYVSGPIVFTAQKMGIKTLIHEQNAFPGVTTKALAKKADVVCLAVQEAKKFLNITGKTFVTGNPVRESIIYKSKAEARKALGLDDKVCIFSFGGSLGATMINRVAADLMEWHQNTDAVNHIHGYGQLGVEIFPKLLKDRGVSLEGKPRIMARQYIDDMDNCLAAADLVICRSGAITLSELEAAGKASVLIPSPTVSENHQYHNAMVLQNHHAAIVIEEKNYKKEEFIAVVKDLCMNPEKLAELSHNASTLAVFDTADQIYRAIRGLVDGTL
ncbi:MAG: undecaprenyldiphospho-muramoylpentapeptide beta-N-acetylglucosaminyltransferase [Oscillospiraceae bacterium]|jgi:UDP-N-acetylglucosamine--N-acetylmuramyl-(pentapeptide) pyrophosphoryl-undecaprenol N-acetylglucosamine transferase